jgi:hypothetical protein
MTNDKTASKNITTDTGKNIRIGANSVVMRKIIPVKRNPLRSNFWALLPVTRGATSMGSKRT